MHCKHPVGENTKTCEYCGAKLSLPDKWRGQHVRKKDILSVDTWFALVAAALTVIVLFLPACGFQSDSGRDHETFLQALTALGETGGGVRTWFLVLLLAFTVIYLSAWFLGEKSRHYFQIAVSGATGCWLLCIVWTFFMAEVCAYTGVDSLALETGYFVWITALVLQTAGVVLYRIQTNRLNRGR
ncbi:MAG: hypothetical protein LUC17_03125 [Oscillospiraceae bacterium]|nr:hypothetical protein [Oscillospiraceae bacterium]